MRPTWALSASTCAQPAAALRDLRPTEEARGKLKPFRSRRVRPERRHERQEEEVRPDPGEDDRDDQEEAELGKELKHAEEQRDARERRRRHAREPKLKGSISNLSLSFQPNEQT